VQVEPLTRLNGTLFQWQAAIAGWMSMRQRNWGFYVHARQIVGAPADRDELLTAREFFPSVYFGGPLTSTKGGSQLILSPVTQKRLTRERGMSDMPAPSTG
jgi:hypothetical protein